MNIIPIPSDLQLKSALVRALPEKLELFTPDLGEMYFRWTVNQMFVSPYEWDAIVRMVEEKLTEEQKDAYARRLSCYLLSWCDLDIKEAFYAVTTSWLRRAQALADIGAIITV